MLYAEIIRLTLLSVVESAGFLSDEQVPLLLPPFGMARSFELQFVVGRLDARLTL